MEQANFKQAMMFKAHIIAALNLSFIVLIHLGTFSIIMLLFKFAFSALVLYAYPYSSILIH